MSARLSSLGLLWASLLLAATAQAADVAAQSLVDADGARVAALVAHDAGALTQLLADDLTYVHTTGAVDDKARLLGKVKSGELVFQSIRTRDLAAHPYGAAGVVTGIAELHVLNKQRPVVMMLRYTATYIQHDGRWQLAAYQATQLPD